MSMLEFTSNLIIVVGISLGLMLTEKSSFIEVMHEAEEYEKYYAECTWLSEIAVPTDINYYLDTHDSLEAAIDNLNCPDGMKISAFLVDLTGDYKLIYLKFSNPSNSMESSVDQNQ